MSCLLLILLALAGNIDLNPALSHPPPLEIDTIGSLQREAQVYLSHYLSL